MHTLTVRIGNDAHSTLKELAVRTGEAMSEILAKAIEEYRRKHFLEGLAHDFAELRRNASSWEEELAERTSWDATLGDGLDTEEKW